MNSRVMVCVLALLVAVLLLPAAAQPVQPIHLVQPVKHDTSPRLIDMLPGKASHERKVIPIYKPNHPGHGGSSGGGGTFTDPVLQSSYGSSSILSSFVEFPGQGTDNDAYAPPDTNGAAGPSQYVQTVNVTLAVYESKTSATTGTTAGTLVYGPVAINTLWSGFGGSCEQNNGGDPIVQYDKIDHRWVVMQIQYSGFGSSGGNYLCIAVSNGSDWTAPTFAFQRYAYKFSTLTDYPKLGIWNDAYYVTFNAFKGFGTYAGPVACAFDFEGSSPTGNSVCATLSSSYFSLLPADIDDASQAPVSGEPEYLVSMGSPLLAWRFHVDMTALKSGSTGTTSLSSAMAVGSSTSYAYQQACGGGTCIPQPNTKQKLDSLGDRLMYRLAYRNFGGHESLVVNHSVTPSSTSAVTGIRWYELRNTASTSSTAPTIYQAGTYAPDSNYRWMGSAAMDAAGDIALGYSLSSSSVHPSIYVTGRCAGDTPGQLRQEVEMYAGGGSQTGKLSRWGDYSSMSVDPSDGSLWYTTEYLPSDGSFNWHTEIANFTLPGCP